MQLLVAQLGDGPLGQGLVVEERDLWRRWRTMLGKLLFIGIAPSEDECRGTPNSTHLAADRNTVPVSIA